MARVKPSASPASPDAKPAGVNNTRKLAGYTAWIFLAAAWLMTALALASYHRADDPGTALGGAIAPFNEKPRNLIGPFGAALAHRIYYMVGLSAWVFLFAGAVFLINTARKKPITQPFLRLIGVIIMTVAAAGILNLAMPAVTEKSVPYWSLVGFAVSNELVMRFYVLGAMITLGLVFWVGAVLAIDQVVMAVPVYLARAMHLMPRVPLPKPALAAKLIGLGRNDATPQPVGGASIDEPVDEDVVTQTPIDPASAEAGNITGSRAFTATPAKPARGKGAVPIFDSPRGESGDSVDVPVELDEAINHHAGEDDDEPSLADADKAAPKSNVRDLPINRGPSIDIPAAGDEPVADAPAAYVAEKNGGAFDPDALRDKIKKLPVSFANASNGKRTEGSVPGAAVMRDVDLSGYRFPGMDLLVEPESNFNAEMERIVRDQALALEQALQQYRIEGTVVGIDSGPVITLYEVRLAAGTKVAVLNAVSSDLARALKASNIRIVPNMTGKDTVGVEVPNQVKEKVRLKELMIAAGDSLQKMALPMFLGKDASGNPLIQDLASMPHMLIAGTTGSGKSVCMNSIIMSFIYTKRPDELKLVLVDPKMVEMSQFKDIPHLMCPVVTEMSKAAAILEWAVTKMDERYELLVEAGVRDISSYNSLTWEELKERFNPVSEAEEARIPKKLPYLVFVIDELADLMMTNKEVEGFIVRIAQKARAVGMHLILATQRPQANVVTGLIKSNMPCRVTFKVASGMDSRIVLDQKGGELLLGHGDMLFLSPRTSKLTRAQGTLVDDIEIRRAVKFLKEIAQQNFEPQLVQIKAAGTADVDEEAAKDPLFEQAVEVVLQTKRGSVSLLQRRLTIGYSRASRLIEAMAAAGILGEYKGSQAREVAITIEEWDAMKAQMAKDAANAEKAGTVFEDKSEDADDDGGVPDEMDDEYKS